MLKKLCSSIEKKAVGQVQNLKDICSIVSEYIFTIKLFVCFRIIQFCSPEEDYEVFYASYYCFYFIIGSKYSSWWQWICCEITVNFNRGCGAVSFLHLPCKNLKTYHKWKLWENLNNFFAVILPTPTEKKEKRTLWVQIKCFFLQFFIYIRNGNPFANVFSVRFKMLNNPLMRKKDEYLHKTCIHMCTHR